MKISPDQKEKIIDVLVTYSSDKFDDMTWNKGRLVTAIYSTILQAVLDLHSGNKELKKEAIKYFEGSVYQKHCEDVKIEMELMDRIVLDVTEYLENIGDYDQEEEDFL